MIWMNRISTAWLIASVTLLIGYWTGWIGHWQAAAYGWLVIGSSLIAFLFNGYDKFQAKRERRRVPERWLHLLELIGGWPGAFYGQQLFRHKTIKPTYRKIFWLMVLSHMLLLGVALYLSLDSSTATPSTPEDSTATVDKQPENFGILITPQQ